jgi:hypothetical protein
LPTTRGFIVAAPTNISIAVRAHLISVAVAHGLGHQLQENLLDAQAKLMRQGAFKLIPPGRIRQIEDHLYREGIQEFCPGRYLHVIQSTDGFSDWPRRAFGSITGCGPKWVAKIVNSIREYSSSLRQRDGFVEGATLWLPGGWGAERGFSYNTNDPIPDWLLITLEPSDVLILDGCEGGKFSDIWRLEKQIGLVEQQGFELFNFSGLLNMFRWWQKTDHALVPPQADASEFAKQA